MLISGTEFNDTLFGGFEADTILGFGGGDRLDGGVGADLLDGGDGQDFLLGGFGSDTLFGGNDNDNLQGGAGDDLLVGGAGNDHLDSFNSESGNDTLEGGVGNDIIYVARDASATADNIILNGDTGNDYFSIWMLSGQAYADGGDGNDYFNMFAGGTLKGGAGVDTFALDGAYPFNTTNATFTIDGFETGITGDVFDLDAVYTRLTNWSGDLTPFATGHFLLSQQGVDTALLADTSGLSAAWATVAIFKNVSLSNFTKENFRGAAPMNGDDTLIGTAPAERRTAGAGNDVIFTLAGNDTAIGGTGSDVLSLGDGDDQGYSGSGINNLIATPDGRGVSSELDYIYAGNGNDTLYGTSRGIDVLLGEAGNHTLADYGGNFSYLYGGAGNNSMRAVSLVNVFISEGLNDVMSSAIVSGASPFDAIAGTDGALPSSFYYRLADGASTVTGGAGVDQFIGGNALSNDSVSGGAGNDYLFGGAGNDILRGGAGDDLILGQVGNDTLEGGAGVNLLWANDAGSDEIRVNIADGGTQVVDYFEAGGTNDFVRLLGSTLTSFAGFEALRNNIGNVVGNNILYNTATSSQLYLNLGANQTAIWFQGVSAYSLTSADFLFS